MKSTTVLVLRIPAVCVAVILLALVGSQGAAHASVGANPQAYLFVVGLLPLCESAPGGCPALATTPGGMTLELTGYGEFSTADGSASGSGDYVESRPNGDVFARGSWQVLRLLSFECFFAYDGVWFDMIKSFTAARAFFLVQLSPVNGTPATAILQIEDTGDHSGPLPKHARTGVTLAVFPDGPSFHRKSGGLMGFLAEGPYESDSR
jgi:hypothetical protein